MKKILLIILLASVFTSSLFAQKNDIKGSVYDSTQNAPIPYISVVLKNDKDSVIYWALTDENGQFVLKNVQKDFKQLYIKGLGFNEKSIDKEQVIDLSSKNDLNIYLSPSTKTLNTVEIIDRRKHREVSIDRAAYSISATEAAAAITIFDILRTVPGVVVDQNNNVRAKGRMATIYVNMQPSQFMYPSIEMIPTNNIYKIEVIDASTYGSSGGAIINIKTKQITQDGLSGVLVGSAGTINTKNIDKSKLFANLNYKYKNIIFFDNFSNRTAIASSNSKTDGEMYFNNNTFQKNNSSSGKSKNESYNNILGFQINTNKTFFMLGAGIYKDITNEKSDMSNTVNINNTLNSFYSTNSNDKEIYPIYGIGSYFKYDFDTLDQNIQVSITLQKTLNKNNGSTLFNQNFSNGIAIDSTLNYRNNNNANLDNLFSNIVYNHPINTNFRWNLGLNSVVLFKSKIKGDYYYDENIYLPNCYLTNMSVQEHTLYSRFGGGFKKWKFDLGLNVLYSGINTDYTRYNLDNSDTILNVNKNFVFLQPSLNLTYTIDSIQDLKFSYTKSTNPLIDEDLCDFINKQNPVSWSVGNSELKPVQYHNLSLGYYLSKDAWNFSSEIFYSLTNNDISNVNYLYSETVSITKPINVAANKSLGIDLSSWWLLNNNYQINLSGSLYHSSVKADSLYDQNYNIVYADQIKRQNFGYNLKLGLNGKFGNTIWSNINFNYVSREITLQGYNFGYITSSASITKKLLNSLYVTFSVQNIFDDLIKHGNYTNYMGLDQTTINNSSNYRRYYTLGFHYTIQKGDRGTKDYKLGS